MASPCWERIEANECRRSRGVHSFLSSRGPGRARRGTCAARCDGPGPCRPRKGRRAHVPATSLRPGFELPCGSRGAGSGWSRRTTRRQASGVTCESWCRRQPVPFARPRRAAGPRCPARDARDPKPEREPRRDETGQQGDHDVGMHVMASRLGHMRSLDRKRPMGIFRAVTTRDAEGLARDGG